MIVACNVPDTAKTPSGAAKVLTVITALLEVILPLVAVMLLIPAATAVTKPVLLTDATATELLDDQVSVPRVAAVPSDCVPLAVNCCVLPTTMLAVVGLMASDANTGAVTVNVALLEVMPFIEAVSVVLPWASVLTTPVVLTVAMLALLEAQVTEPDIAPVLPSE